MADTRSDKRAPVSLKVRFKSATVDEFAEQYSVDISRGGIFIKSKKPMKIGTLLKFELQLKDESRLIHGVGRVVWRRDPETATEAVPAGMGIKFIKMDAESRGLVQKIVENRPAGPGRFDAGEAGAVEAPKEKNESFFPDSGPAELPPPEDRTQVRHASEFLANALSDGDAAEEAQANADAARKRTEEIQAEREAAEAQRKADQAAAAARERDREAAQHEAAEVEDLPIDEDDDGLGALFGDDPVADEAERRAALGAADTALAASVVTDAAATTPGVHPLGGLGGSGGSRRSEPEVTDTVAVADEAFSAQREVDTDRPPASTEEEGSGMKIAGVMLLAAAIGFGLFWYMNREREGPVDEVAEEVVDDQAVDEELIEDPVEEEVPVVSVAVSSNVAAEIYRNGESLGTTPLEVELPEGEEVTLEARAEGYGGASQTVVGAQGMAPVAFELAELTWAIEVSTDPEGARVAAAGRYSTSPGRIDLDAVDETITITATKPGFRMASTTIEPSAFQEQDGVMVATVTLELPARTPATTMMAAAMMEAATMEEAAASNMETPPTMEAAVMDAPSAAPGAMEAASTEAAVMEATPMEATPTMAAPVTMEAAAE